MNDAFDILTALFLLQLVGIAWLLFVVAMDS